MPDKSIQYYSHSLILKLKALLSSIYPQNGKLDISQFEFEGWREEIEFPVNLPSGGFYLSYLHLSELNPLMVQNPDENPTLHAYSALNCYNHFQKENNNKQAEYFLKFCDRILKNQMNDKGGILIPFDIREKELFQPWYSAISNGLAVSCMLRYYMITKDDTILDHSRKLADAMFIPVEENGTLLQLGEKIWMEEYPTKKPSMVLNGFIFSIIGILELHIISPDKKRQMQCFALISSLLHFLPEYLYLNNIRYSKYKFHFANLEYMMLHISQFMHLFHLTRIKGFERLGSYYSKRMKWNIAAMNFPIGKLQSDQDFARRLNDVLRAV